MMMPPASGEGEEGEGLPPGPMGGGMELSILGPIYRDWTPDRVPPAVPEIPAPHKKFSDINRYSDVQTLTD